MASKRGYGNKTWTMPGLQPITYSVARTPWLRRLPGPKYYVWLRWLMFSNQKLGDPRPWEHTNRRYWDD